MSTEEKTTSNPEAVEHPKPKRRFKLDKKHIQGFIAGVLVSAIVFTGLLAGYNPSFLTGSYYYYISEKTVADIDTIYYLQGGSTKLEYANNKAQKIKFIPTGKQYGFEDIDIIVEGSEGDQYTLVFGVSSYDSPAKMTLVGAAKYNPYIDWIPLTSIEWIPSSENGDFYQSNKRWVAIRVKKSGIETFVSPIHFSQTAGVIIQFAYTGKTDSYSVFHITLTGKDGSTKTYKVLCRNICL